MVAEEGGGQSGNPCRLVDPETMTTGNDVELGVRNYAGGAFADGWGAKGVVVAPDQLDGLRETSELCFGELYPGPGAPKANHGMDQLEERRSRVGQPLVGQDQLPQLG